MISPNAAVGCSVPGCCRRARLTAQFLHENGDSAIESVCCYECVAGEGHSEECDAAASALQQQQQAAAQDVGDVFLDDDDDPDSDDDVFSSGADDDDYHARRRPTHQRFTRLCWYYVC